MKLTKSNIFLFLTLLIFPALFASCGPILGQMSKLREGVSQFEIVSGDISRLKGQSILVLGPFSKTERAFYLCRGEDASSFAEGLASTGSVPVSLIIDQELSDKNNVVHELRKLSTTELKEQFGITKPVNTIMTGKLMFRKTMVAPMRGVIISTTYRLQFFTEAKQPITIVATVTAPFEEAVPLLTDRLIDLINS